VRKERSASLETGLSGPICGFDIRLRANAQVPIWQRTDRGMLHALSPPLVFYF